MQRKMHYLHNSRKLKGRFTPHEYVTKLVFLHGVINMPEIPTYKRHACNLGQSPRKNL